jgi:hypothetical protein
MTEILIDTAAYERKYGKPAGHHFWTFKVVSPSLTTKTSSSRPTSP